MASTITSREMADKPLPGDGARILLVNKDSRDVAYYGAVLKKVGCRVRASSSFAGGTQCLAREPYDLIVLDQGSSGFEGREVLMSAMEVDPEVPVLVLARSYDRGCYEEAMRSGALDYVEGPLNEAEIVALLETFIPRPAGSRGLSASRVKGATPDKKTRSKAEFKRVHLAKCVAGDSREELRGLDRPRYCPAQDVMCRTT
jgi:DNA-binding NtrC family response regulator